MVHRGGGTVEGGVLNEVKNLSCSKTGNKPNSTKRAVDARADLLPQVHLPKARDAERKHAQTMRAQAAQFLGNLTVRCQTMSLLDWLEVLGPGASAAAGRRWQSAELESCWRRGRTHWPLPRAGVLIELAFAG